MPSYKSADSNSQLPVERLQHVKEVASVLPVSDHHELTADTTERSNRLPDLLPSFQLHNYMFNRTLTETSLVSEMPPRYETCVRGTTEPPSVLAEPAYILNFQNSKLLLKNIDKLQKVNLPLEAKISLTEEQTPGGSLTNERDPFKQYLPGDMLHGVVVLENKSDFKIPFETILVSMNCEIGTMNPQTLRPTKAKILEMYDLEASLTFASVTQDDSTGTFDPATLSYTTRAVQTLDPGATITQCFYFQIPHNILDDCCKNQLVDHLQLPPSFGIDNSALNFTASTIHVNKTLGYGKLDKSGSPIKVNDYATYGEYCSFFIKVQMLGKKHEAFEPFYKPKPLQDYEFTVLKSTEYHFRVGKPPPPGGGPGISITTESQLKIYETLAMDTMQMVIEEGLQNKDSSSCTKIQNQKRFNSSDEKAVIEVTHSGTYTNDYEQPTEFQRITCVEYKKGLLTKLDGKLITNFKFNKTQCLQSFLPKLLEQNASCPHFTEMSSKGDSPYLSLQLEYKPGKSAINDIILPTTITIIPNMVAVSIQSAYSIPFTVDNEFLFKSPKAIQQLFAKFALYHNKILEVMKINNYGVPKRTLQLLKGLGYCKYKEIPIPDIFKSQKVSISQNMWTYDQQQNVFRCAFDVPLQYDIKSIRDTPKCLTPSFQTCLLARLYKINFEVSPSRGKTSVVSFPITVV